MEQKNIEKEIKRQTNSLIIITLIPLILNGLLNYGICNIHLFNIYMPTIFFSFLIMYGIYFFIVTIVKKTSIATYILSSVIFLISIISNIKLYYSRFTSIYIWLVFSKQYWRTNRIGKGWCIWTHRLFARYNIANIFNNSMYNIQEILLWNEK